MLDQLLIEYKTFYYLLLRDLRVFRSQALDNYVNTLCWVILTLLVYQFIMPNMGCNFSGDFILVSCIISKTFLGIMDGVTNVIADFEGNKNITYEMTLPISHTSLFIKIAISHAIYAFLIACCILPIGKLLLWKYLIFPHFNLGKVLLIMIISSLFSGFFSLYVISVTKSLSRIEDIWNGVIFPLFYLGGFNFTWKIMYETSPCLAYLNMLNPVMYMYEGMRSAALNPTESLPFYWCIIMLIIFTFISGYIGIYKLKQRLNAI